MHLEVNAMGSTGPARENQYIEIHVRAVSNAGK
jgi:hypothetical protein